MRFADWRAGKDAVLLLLKDGHYQLARLKQGKQLPREWSEAEVAGDDWRPPSTPSSCSSWRPMNTPSTVNSKGARTKGWEEGPSSSSTFCRSSASKAWRPESTPPSAAVSVQPQQVHKTRPGDLSPRRALRPRPVKVLLPCFRVSNAGGLLSASASSKGKAATPASCSTGLRSLMMGLRVLAGLALLAVRFLRGTLRLLLRARSVPIVPHVILRYHGKTILPVRSSKLLKPERISRKR